MRSLQASPPSRREFLGATLAATCQWGIGGSAARSETVEAKSALIDPSGALPAYIDIHVHLTQSWYGADRGPLSARKLLAWMDAHHVEKAAVLPLVSPEAFWYPITTEFVLTETSPHRDRLIPFCAIDPRALETHLTNPQDVRDMLRRYRDAGACGFGEHKSRLAIDDPLNRRLYEACAETSLPVLFHLDNQANTDRPGLPGLASVLTDLPDLVMIGHGKGWWSSISGGVTQADLHVGYPRGPVAPGGAVSALMERHRNLYADLSSSGAHALLRDRKFGQSFIERWSDRLLFGTDYYDLTQLEFPQFSLFDEFSVTPEARQAIARGNAERLLARR